MDFEDHMQITKIWEVMPPNNKIYFITDILLFCFLALLKVDSFLKQNISNQWNCITITFSFPPFTALTFFPFIYPLSDVSPVHGKHHNLQRTYLAIHFHRSSA